VAQEERKKERKKNRVKSLDFVLNSVLEKIYLIKYYHVVSECITFSTVRCLTLLYKNGN